ncbi:serine/threonine-protein kinase [Streptomyces caeruleatus]|uniref:Serine/threonine protein kinase n=1 Tax=Streptomyces caeruleatus TaxID=661399 RepID=A0A101TUX4_9ACTN|nr:serine/threonine-protein kinase [Streptomyces caeruleatus]KUN98972.1 serine/threonine protein kinase [Streptomyces caeruleatus]
MNDQRLLEDAGATPLRPADPGRIGPYLSLGLLGSGGMGRVYLARPVDNSPGLAAVKVIRPEYAEDPRFRRRFEREASLHARVRSAQAPQLLGTGFDDSLLWMATQYLPGLNLADAVRECGTLECLGVWRLVGDLGQALSALAVAGVVHRDLKPSNVILSPQGAHVIDFGIAQATDSSAITSTGSRVGTPAFMAPEYLREGRCDTASDVFSLAGSLIYAATGHAPFGDGTGVDVMHRVAFEEPKADVMAGLAARDADLAALLSACLSKDPAGRPTPGQLTQAAAAAGHGRVPSWHEPLAGRLLARRQACDVLEQVPVQQLVQNQQGAYETVQLRTRTAHSALPTPGPTQAPTLGDGGGRKRRRAYLAVTAGLAVCALAAGAFLLTRPSPADTAPAAATAAQSSAPAEATASPSPTASPSADKDKGKGKGKEKGKGDDKGTGKDTGSAAEESADPDASTGGTGGGTRATPTDETSAPSGGDGSGGGNAPTPTPTKTATTPATPPWLSDCTHYSGTELTARGDKGRRVLQVQCMLTKRGYSVGGSGVDGEFGADTESAVRLFQSDKGLAVDGEVGPNTWAGLRRST